MCTIDLGVLCVASPKGFPVNSKQSFLRATQTQFDRHGINTRQVSNLTLTVACLSRPRL